MPFSSISGVLSSNCERFAITLGNETRLRLIWLLTATNGKSGPAGSMGFISLVAARRQICSDDERDRRNARAGNIRTMNRRSRSWASEFASVGLSLLVLDYPAVAADVSMPLKARSEERRVGKESRS